MSNTEALQAIESLKSGVAAQVSISQHEGWSRVEFTVRMAGGMSRQDALKAARKARDGFGRALQAAYGASLEIRVMGYQDASKAEWLYLGSEYTGLRHVDGARTGLWIRARLAA
jgi:hypothetical protein